MELNGKRVLVVGLAKSGMAAIRLLHEFGAVITLSEARARDQINELDQLNAYGVTVCGQQPEDARQGFDLCIKNPGVPESNPFIQALRAEGVPVITEIELAFQLAKPQHYLAITGSNGKTTTATLCYEVIRAAYPEKTHLCGNIGTPLCDVILDENLLNEEGHYIVLEVSNFQLINIDRFRPEAATIINLSPDHLDVMGSLEAYYKSKTEVYRNMEGDDFFLVNADDPVLAEYLEKYPVRCKTAAFSLERADTEVCLRNENICIAGEDVVPLSDIHVVGRHNQQNVMVAASLAKYCGVPNETIRKAVSEFKGVEHRIEYVREWNGVKFYNDSKGTNTDATVTALKAFDKGVILLAGGFEKGLPMDDVKAHMGCVKQLIGYGACGPRIVRETVGDKGIVVTTLDEALAEAVKIAEPGDVVLLSPTTSSFDQFRNMEERGEHFKELVNAL